MTCPLEIVSLSSGTLMLVSWAKGYVVLASVGRETYWMKPRQDRYLPSVGATLMLVLGLAFSVVAAPILNTY